MPEVTDRSIRDLIAREEIRQVLMKYCRGVDRRLWSDVASCYHPDAVDDHGAFKGRMPELMDWFRTRHETVSTSVHFIGNILLEVEGDSAAAETYFLHVRRVPASEVGPENVAHVCRGGACGSDIADVVMYGRYLDIFENRAGSGWRIADRLVVGDARNMMCPAADFPLPEGWLIGRRDEQDGSVPFLEKWRAARGLGLARGEGDRGH